jgi:hypothetical protein
LAPPLTAGVARTIAFMYLDGALQFAVDGEVRLTVPIDMRLFREEELRFGGARLNNLLHVGAAGCRFTVQDLELVHDIHYRSDGLAGPAGQAVQVPAGFYYLLGDNSRESSDSRAFGPISGSAIVGRPLLVLAPLARARWFPR